MSLISRQTNRIDRTRWAIVFIASPLIAMFGFDSAAHAHGPDTAPHTYADQAEEMIPATRLMSPETLDPAGLD